MSQSLFDVPAATGPAGGVLEQMMEGQEQLRGELGLMAERLAGLERNQARLVAGAQAAVVELERRPTPSRVPLYAALAAILLAAVALAIALL
jgi:hypothetical protein